MIVVNLDVVMAQRKMTLSQLAEKVDITLANLSILKNNKAKAVRFSTLEAICAAWTASPATSWNTCRTEMLPCKGVNATGPVPAERTVKKGESHMEGPKNALPQEGLEKCTPKPADACDISRRERWLLAVTFAFCLLTVNTLFDAGAGAGWAAAVAGWYAVLYASHGPALWRTGESRFLLVTDLALALFSLVLGSSDYFRMWDTLALLLVLLPVHTAGLSGGQKLPWWRPAMLWERACLLLSGLFSRLGAFPAALSPGGPAPGGGWAPRSWAAPGRRRCWPSWCRPWRRRTRCSASPPRISGPSWTSTSRRPRPRPWPPR